MNKYDDDFLDSLMEEVLNADEKESSSNIEETNQREVIDDNRLNIDTERKVKPSSGGLLNRLSQQYEDKDKHEETSEHTESPSEKNDISEIHEDETVLDDEEDKTKDKPMSLIERMRSRVNDTSEPDKDNESAEDEELTEEKEEIGKTILTIPSENSSDISIKFIKNISELEKEKSDSDVDNLDDMLKSLDEEATTTNEVEVPLEKENMKDVIVTADGKSLADMLQGMRGGTRKVHEVVKDIKSGNSVVDIGNKKFSDGRYLKHVKVIDEERARDEERVKLSMEYLQRNATFTEQEKIIMRNLGLTSEQLAKVMRAKELSKKQKEELLSLGRYGSEKHFKGKRYRTTVGDTAMLEFLSKFKFANTRILRWISNEPQLRTWRKLNRLRDSGLVESKSIIGIPDLWGATPSGVAISGYSYEPGLRPMPKMFSISSNMGVNYIAACLWFNSINVLNLPDFPANNRIISLQDDGREKVRGEMLVSEYEIRRSLGKEINPTATTMKTIGDERLYDVISANVSKEVEDWRSNGRIGEGPETYLGNEYMWVLYPTSQLTLSYHVPDLVVKRDRGPNGEPRSIAVELERYDKSNDRYDKIMLAYKLDEHLYEKVVWITPNQRVARMLEKAAKDVGFDRYSILPIITETGTFDKPDIWMI